MYCIALLHKQLADDRQEVSTLRKTSGLYLRKERFSLVVDIKCLLVEWRKSTVDGSSSDLPGLLSEILKNGGCEKVTP